MVVVGEASKLLLRPKPRWLLHVVRRSLWGGQARRDSESGDATLRGEPGSAKDRKDQRGRGFGVRQRSPPPPICPRGRPALRTSQDNPRLVAKKARLPPSAPRGEQTQEQSWINFGAETCAGPSS